METNINLKSWVWQTLGFLLIGFLALLVLDKVHTVVQDFRPTVPQNTIAMSAEGRVTAKPDLATINVGVQTNGDTAKAAQDANNKNISKVIDSIKKLGVTADDIQTSNLSVYPTYDYANGKNTINGYQANQTLTVKVRGVDRSTETLNKTLDAAVVSGSNQIQGVSFSVDDPDSFRQAARKQAIDKAKQKAQELADQTGLKLGRIVNISESSANYPVPLPYAMDGRGGGAAAPSNIQTGTTDITAEITVTFELK